MKKRILATVLATAMAVTTLFSSAVFADTKKITIAVPDPESSYIYAAAQEFANRAAEYSNGSLEFTISGNGSLYGGDTAAGIKQLGAGSLQMLILASSVYANFVPGFNVISVPYMFDDQAQLVALGLHGDVVAVDGTREAALGR